MTWVLLDCSHDEWRGVFEVDHPEEFSLIVEQSEFYSILQDGGIGQKVYCDVNNALYEKIDEEFGIE